MDLFFTSGLLGLFLSSFLAATIIPMSSEGVLSLLLYNGFDTMTCLAIASAGNTLGGMTTYCLGRLGKLEWLEKRMNISNEKILKARRYVDAFKGPLAFFCWLPLVGDLLAVSLGYFRCKAVPVLLFMVAGKVARYLVWAWFTTWSIDLFR